MSRTEPDKPFKPIFGVHEICKACKGKGTRKGYPSQPCSYCGGNRWVEIGKEKRG